jgi:ATP-dependent Clp protease ATP-binding subunit ClpC
MLDDGFLTDSFGRKINFKNTLIIMTSNIGVKKLQDFGTGVGFDTTSRLGNTEELKKLFLQKELKNFFTPEFLNRVDEIVMFNPLKEEEVRKIVDIELQKLIDRLNKMGYEININDDVRNHIANVGFDDKYGARPIKRAIQDKIEDYISEEVLRKNIKIGSNRTLILKDGEVKLGEI